MEAQKPQFTLRPFPPDELTAFNNALQELCDKHSAHLVAKPSIAENGTITSNMMAFKKIQLVPKEDGTLVPKDEPTANGKGFKTKK